MKNMLDKNAFKKNLRNFSNNWQLYLLVLPAMLYLFFFHYRAIYGLQIAFKDYSARLGIWRSEWVGLSHFKRFISHPRFGTYMINTLRIGLYGLATFPCSIIFALLLNELKNLKFKKVVQMVSYMPHFLSTVIICSMVTLFMDEKSGVINNIIAMLGGERVEFLAVAHYFDDIYVWSGVWAGLGWGSILYVSALAGVSPELIDAARIDGATRIQTIWHVKLPWILPTVLIQLIFAAGGIVSVGNEKILLLQNPLNLSYSQVVSNYTYEIGLISGQFSYSSAIGLFNTMINLFLLLIVNYISKKITDIGVI